MGQGKLLVSACLLGEAVRYDGQSKGLDDSRLVSWQREDRIVAICPEVAGGLSVPRDPAEIAQADGGAVLDGESRVVSIRGADVTAAFLKGARLALKLARDNQIRLALLKANSPSCGNLEIYDGSFSNRRKEGMGIAAALLRRHGIDVYNENQLDELEVALTIF